MPQLDSKQQKRLGDLLARLGSDSDGEIVACAKLAMKICKEANVDIRQVLGGSVSVSFENSPAEVTGAYNRGYREGFAKGAASAASRAPQRVRRRGKVVSYKGKAFGSKTLLYRYMYFQLGLSYKGIVRELQYEWGYESAPSYQAVYQAVNKE